MKYEKGDIVRVVSTYGYSGLNNDHAFVGSIGVVINQNNPRGIIYVSFYRDRDENSNFFKKYSIVGRRINLVFGFDEIEPYILDVNFLD